MKKLLFIVSILLLNNTFTSEQKDKQPVLHFNSLRKSSFTPKHSPLQNGQTACTIIKKSLKRKAEEEIGNIYKK